MGMAFAALLLALVMLYAAVATGSRELVEVASMAVIAVVLLAFIVWFIAAAPSLGHLDGGE